MQTNTTLQSLTLLGYIAVKSAIVIDAKRFFGIPISDDGKKTSKIFNDKKTMDVKVTILCHGDHGCSSEVISMSKESIKGKILYNHLSEGIGTSASREVVDLDALYLISLGLYNNTSIKTLDLSCNKITNDGLMIIIDCLKHNNTIKQLNLSHNSIDEIGMDKLSEFALSLEYIDITENKSSPWKAYCAIIRNCYSNNLTLCGDKGIKAHTQEITDSLKINTTLQSLTLHGYMSRNTLNKTVKRTLVIDGKIFFSTPIKDDGNKFSNKNSRVVDVKVNYMMYCGNHEYLREAISMPNKCINDDAVCLITFGLYNNTTVKRLDLSNSSITDDGAFAISNCLKYNCFLQILKLSGNSISFKGAENILKSMHRSNIQELDLSRTYITNDGMIATSEYLKTNNTLQVLNLSDSFITSEGAKKIAEILRVNDSIRELDVSRNNICDDGVMYIGDIFSKNNTLLELNLSRIAISDRGAESIIKATQADGALQKLDLSYNYISEHVVNVNSIHLHHYRTLKEVIWKPQLQML